MTIFELLLVAFTLLLGMSIVWGTIKTGISPMLSSRKATHVMLSVVAKNDIKGLSGAIVDLGSGWGTLVHAAAKRYPEKEVIGYELSLIPWLVSVLLKRYYQLDNLTIYRQDFHCAELNNASFLFCFLYPEGMDRLFTKLCQDKVTAVKIVSNTFAINKLKPIEVVRLTDTYHTNIYFYDWLRTY